MSESIFRSFLRSFFVRFGTILGLLLGILLTFVLIGAFFGKKDDAGKLEYSYSPTIRANALGEREVLPDTSPVILKMNLQGTIGLENLNRHKTRELLIESREKTLKDDRVKAILLCIDTPGGTVTDADGIYRLLKEYKERYKTPIYAYVDGLCASGGMYVACAADKIYASESSIVGSIGVMVSTAMNFTKVMDKIGIESLTLTAGKGKDELNPFRPWKPDESKNYQALINDFYLSFVDIVTTNRPEVNKEKLVDEYGANVFTAAKAKEIGLIDEVGFTYSQTLELLAKDVGLNDEKYQVIELTEDNWINALFRSQANNPLLKGELKHSVQLQGELDPKLTNQFLYLKQL